MILHHLQHTSLSLPMKAFSTFYSLLAFASLVSAATRSYTLTLSQGTAAPDGFSRPVHLINGQTPGPHLTADEGDNMVITIINNIQEPLTIHFHGIEMRGAVWSDGVPGVTQRLIEPGVTFVYRFPVLQHGLYWYHAHSRALYADGVRGTFFIKPNTANLAASPFWLINSGATEVTAMKTAHNSPKILGVNDWMHTDSETDLGDWERTKTETICVDTVMINGKGRGICPPPSTFAPFLGGPVPAVTAKGCAYPNNTALNPFTEARPDLVRYESWFTCKNTTSPLSVIEVKKTDLWASIAIVNMAHLWDIKVSIDNHPLWVYAADGQYHYPQEVDSVVLPPGERFQAMIKLDKAVGDYAIRAATFVTPQFLTGYGVLSYSKSSTTGTVIPASINASIGYAGNNLPNKKELAPYTLKAYPSTLTPPQTANVTLKFHLHRAGTNTWIMNQDPFQAHLEDGDPLLFNPSVALSYDPDLVPKYPVGSIVDIVLISDKGNPPHPVHKHGVKAWIIGQGRADFTWANVAEAKAARPELFNLVNPPYRDGFHTLDSIPEPTFTVFRFKVTEPGAIFMHCHINLHAFGGMGVALMEGMDAPPTIPQYYIDWNEAQKAAASGLKRRMVGRSLEAHRRRQAS